MRPEGKRDGWLVVVLLLVFAGVIGSLGALARWKGQGGAVGSAPARWPTTSHVPRTPGRVALVQFITPSCPCTRASLHELGDMSSKHPEVDTVIVVADDADANERTHAAVLEAAHEVPHAQIFADVGGVEAARFGAMTSGHTVVFDTEGRRLYAGGITLARGHEGDNAGRRAAVAALEGRAAHEESPTYGCALEAQEPPAPRWHAVSDGATEGSASQ